MRISVLSPQKKQWLTYGAVALAIMLPMLMPGYIFALDMAFAPHIALPEHVTSSYLFYAVLHVLNFVIPSELLQKALLLTILLCSGIGMHRLVLWLQKGKHLDRTYDVWGAYIAGVLYMVNPFTYSRFMVGQFAVLLGYALMPLFVLAMLRLYEAPDLKRSIIIAAWLTLIGIVSIHSLGLVFILALVSLPLVIHRNRANPGRLIEIARFGGIGIGLAIVASLYWLAPLITGNSSTAQAIASFNSGDQQAFATIGGDIINRVANVLQLQGFWAEGIHSYLLPQNILPIWFLVVIGLWVLIDVGLVHMWRHGQRFAFLLFGGAAVIAVVLATTNLSNVIADNVFFFAGYREPQKFIALLAMAYAVAASFGASSLLHRYKQRRSEIKLSLTVICVLILPVLLTPTMFWAFGNQLTPKKYPADWYAMNERLNKDPEEGRVLFLPWHLYMSFSFTRRIVVNPADQFFDRPTIVSNELEYAGASPTMPDAEKTEIGRVLDASKKGGHGLGAALASHDIRYVLLSKDDDYRSYDYVNHQPDMQLVTETKNLKLYRYTAEGRN
jgi:hypothetical protein